MAEPTATSLTFEDGYQRLQQIATRLNQEDVPVSEMCDLFEQGKGLEQALTAFLDTQKARVEAIQRGDGVRAFRITTGTSAITAGSGAASAIELSSLPVDTADFVPTSKPTSGIADDDIPF